MGDYKSVQQTVERARKASRVIGVLSNTKRQHVLRRIARELHKQSTSILRANAKDIAAFDPENPMRDRLLLTEDRIKNMASELEAIAKLPDPIGEEYDQRTRNGLQIRKKRVPFGVIGVIYESRPNVTTDVTGIALKSGNAVVLKGGKEAAHSYAAIMKVIRKALKESGLPTDAVQMIDPLNRKLVEQLITADDYVDLIVPRGSQGLIQYVRTTATVPVIETGAGVCHTFVDKSAPIQKSAQVVFNAKTQRPSVCNSLDTLLVHKDAAKKLLPLVAELVQEKDVVIYADPKSHGILSKHYPKKLLKKAKKSDFGREFLSQQMSIKVVPSIEVAIEHIHEHSSRHSEAILTQSKKNQELFLAAIDAAVVYTNASTRFSDGAVFGLGAEIGISTQKMHARGPMGLQEMTTYKWIVQGDYQVRT